MDPIALYRHNLYDIPSWELYIHYTILAVIIVIYLWWIYKIFKKTDLSISRAWNYFIKNWKNIFKNLFLYGVFQRKIVKDKYAGVMHILISYGILILTISTTLVFLDNDIPPIKNTILVGSFLYVFEAFSDTGGLMLVTGLLMALYRRARKRVKLHTVWDDYIIIFSLLTIAIEGFVLEGLTTYIENNTIGYYLNEYRYLGNIMARLFTGVNIDTAIRAYQILWGIHFTTVFIVLGYALISKLSHVMLSPLYTSIRKDKVRGEMLTPFKLEDLLQSGNYEFKLGIEKMNDLKSIQRFEALACTDCGRCERACPATAAGRELSPRVLMQTLKANVGGDKTLVPELFSEEFLWSCTTCQACVEECPVTIDPQSYILEMRRDLVLKSKIDKQKVQFLDNLTYAKNPLGNAPSERNIWVEKSKKYENEEYLLWMGCMASSDPRTKSVAESVIKIFKKANLSFGVLGEEESCCGESARRLGEEGRFQELVMQNVAVFKNHNIKRIVTFCPHGYNTFRNEYSKFIDGLEVYHHSQIIEKLIEDGKLAISKESIVYTYHDPCYLGRINGEYDAPRFIIQKAGDLVEMDRSKSKSFCCGGGGANYWYKVNEKEPISHIRIEEASGKSNNLVVSCPFCLNMLEDAARTTGKEKMTVKDISEIIAEQLND